METTKCCVFTLYTCSLVFPNVVQTSFTDRVNVIIVDRTTKCCVFTLYECSLVFPILLKVKYLIASFVDEQPCPCGIGAIVFYQCRFGNGFGCENGILLT